MDELRQPDHLNRHLSSVPPFRALLRSVECRLIEQDGPLASPLLDLGCGDGHFATMAYRKTPDIGIDPDLDKLRQALRRQSHRHLVATGAERMPFAEGSFATVVANCVLEHIPDLDGALREIARVTEPGGRLLFGVPSHRFADMLFGSSLFRRMALPGFAKAYGDWFNRHSKHYHVDPPEVWLRRLDEHGFEVEDWCYYISEAGLKAIDLAHYVSVPRLISYWITGRWVPFQVPGMNALYDRWLRPHYQSESPDIGAYIFFRARRRPVGAATPT
jgi:SAM-dependent methyltransferase